MADRRPSVVGYCSGHITAPSIVNWPKKRNEYKDQPFDLQHSPDQPTPASAAQEALHRERDRLRLAMCVCPASVYSRASGTADAIAACSLRM
jgi:hypothetical protein